MWNMHWKVLKLHVNENYTFKWFLLIIRWIFSLTSRLLFEHNTKKKHARDSIASTGEYKEKKEGGGW